jgi:4'-phosphopantetheinyl transferase EntD
MKPAATFRLPTQADPGSLGDLLPEACPSVVVSIAHFRPPPLHPAELALVRTAAPRRRREFAVGRACARAAFSSLQVRPGPILIDPTGAPLWPQGFVGSISHGAEVCAAAVGSADRFSGIGIDIEAGVPIDEGVAETFSAEDERRRIERSVDSTAPTALLFSMKEAALKAHWSAFAGDPSFEDVAVVETHPPSFVAAITSDVEPVRLLTGRFYQDAQLIVTAVAVGV